MSAPKTPDFDFNAELERARHNARAWTNRLDMLEAMQRRAEAATAPPIAPKPRGRNGGRRKLLDDQKIILAKTLIQTHSIDHVSNALNVSKTTLRRCIKQKTPAHVCTL